MSTYDKLVVVFWFPYSLIFMCRGIMDGNNRMAGAGALLFFVYCAYFITKRVESGGRDGRDG